MTVKAHEAINELRSCIRYVHHNKQITRAFQCVCHCFITFAEEIMFHLAYVCSSVCLFVSNFT